jgi:hypothetical protein
MNLVDITGNYKREAFVGVPGGQLMQIFYVLDTIRLFYGQDGL